nr:NUDIX domain-containing protein [Kofleriaceae bacterium]
MAVKDAFCSFCGARFAEPLSYPRTCGQCRVTIWANPIPVVVVLLPVIDDLGMGARNRTGLLVVRRAIPPGIGMLALVGGFLEEHESWQVGGAREVREEASIVLEPTTLQPFWWASSSPKPNRVLLFATAPAIARSELPAWTPDHEASERGVVFGPGGLDAAFCFSTHVEAAHKWFATRDVSGPHAFEPV